MPRGPLKARSQPDPDGCQAQIVTRPAVRASNCNQSIVRDCCQGRGRIVFSLVVRASTRRGRAHDAARALSWVGRFASDLGAKAVPLQVLKHQSSGIAHLRQLRSCTEAASCRGRWIATAFLLRFCWSLSPLCIVAFILLLWYRVWSISSLLFLLGFIRRKCM